MEHRQFKLAAFALVGLLAAAPLAAEKELSSADIQDSMEDLRASLGSLAAQVNTANSKIDAIKFSGDVRVRYENVIDRSIAGPTDPDRERYRFRVRFQGDAKVNDFTRLKLRLASDSALGGGSTYYGDPVSTNQTMTDYGAKKPIYLDVAAAEFAFPVVLSPKLTAGKAVTGFYAVPGEMIFDGDLTPEGFYLSLNHNLFSGLNVAVNGAEYLTNELKSSTLDGKFEGEQAVVAYDLGFANAKLTLSAAYYAWQNTTGADAFTSAKTTTVTSQDNNTNSAALSFWINDYTADLKAEIAGVSADLFYEYAYNAQQSQDNIGYLVGLELGSAKLISYDSDFIKVGYNYRVSQKNYTFSPWNFSDFANGETDAMGSQSFIKLKLFPNTEMALNYYSDIRGLSTIAAGGNGKLYERYQWDVSVKF